MGISHELFYKLENKILDRNFVINPNDSENIRFCIAHIVLKAIALTKDPKSDKSKVKDLFDLASEIMAISEVKTEKEDQRLKDLIDAMIDGEDVTIQMRKMSSELTGAVKSLESRMLHKIDLLEENITSVENVTQDNKKLLENRGSAFSILKMGALILAFIAFILCTFIGITVILVTQYNQASQPQSQPSKSSFIQSQDLMYQHDILYPSPPSNQRR